jgi:hypothetical protein
MELTPSVVGFAESRSYLKLQDLDNADGSESTGLLVKE